MADPKTSRALQLAARSLGRLGREFARAGDVTPQQAETLQLVVERGSLSTSSLATLLGIDPSTASRNLAGLERAGYIVRRRGTDDGRQTDVRARRPAEGGSPTRSRPAGRPPRLLCSSVRPDRTVPGSPTRSTSSQRDRRLERAGAQGDRPRRAARGTRAALPSALLFYRCLATLGVRGSAALAPCGARLVARELVRRARGVRRLAALASDLARRACGPSPQSRAAFSASAARLHRPNAGGGVRRSSPCGALSSFVSGDVLP